MKAQGQGRPVVNGDGAATHGGRQHQAPAVVIVDSHLLGFEEGEAVVPLHPAERKGYAGRPLAPQRDGRRSRSDGRSAWATR